MFKPVTNKDAFDADVVDAYRRRSNDARLNEALQSFPRQARNYLPVVTNNEDPFQKAKAGAGRTLMFQWIAGIAFFSFAAE